MTDTSPTASGQKEARKMVTITPALPYFAATFDCAWRTARRIAAEYEAETGEDGHVAAVDAAERLASAEEAQLLEKWKEWEF